MNPFSMDHHNGYHAMASQRRRCWPLQRRDSNAKERSRQADSHRASLYIHLYSLRR